MRERFSQHTEDMSIVNATQFTDNLLEELTSITHAYDSPPVNGLPIFIPKNFDEILARKSEIQTVAIGIGKSEKTNARYSADLIQKELTTESSKKRYIEEEIMQGSHIKIVENIYPSQLPPDSSHYNTWFYDSVDIQQVAEAITDFMIGKELTERDIVVFENPHWRKSLPEVRHFHMFIREHNDYKE